MILAACWMGTAAGMPADGGNLANFQERDFLSGPFRFRGGESLPELRIHYRTFGTPRRDTDGRIVNAVLLLHGTTGSGTQWLQPSLAGSLFGDGQPLDASRFFLIVPDGLGSGKSSRPSGGLRARFPRYGYRDMVEAQRRLVSEGLGIRRLRLVAGTSMGGMHAWLWGEMYPDAMDALMPIACLPTPIRGRNLLWRRIIVDAIRSDPAYNGGDYARQPPALASVRPVFRLITESPASLDGPEFADPRSTDAALADARRAADEMDANDLVAQFEVSGDYDPAADLGKIRAGVLAVNFADDEVNPVELGVLDREIRRVPTGRAVTLPAGPATKGHQTYTEARLWGPLLADLLKSTEPTLPRVTTPHNRPGGPRDETRGSVELGEIHAPSDRRVRHHAARRRGGLGAALGAGLGLAADLVLVAEGHARPRGEVPRRRRRPAGPRS